MILVVRLGPAVVAARSIPRPGNRKAPAVLHSAGALSVGDTGFEPVTFSVSGRRAPRLRQSPRGTPRAYQTPRAPRATSKARGKESGEPGRTEAVVAVRRLAGASGRTALAGCPSKRGPYRTCARYAAP